MKITTQHSSQRFSKHWTLTRAALILTASGALATPMFNAAPAHAQYSAPIGVIINGTQINVGSVTPLREGGRVLVPLRGVLEALGATVGYNNATSTVTARRGATDIALRLGSTQALVNGAIRTLDVPARTINGRTVVPLRFMSEALGATVQYDGARNAVYITTSGVNSPNVVNPPVVASEVTVRGRVIRGSRNANRFEIRTDSGAVVTVRSTYNQLTSLSVGDRVELRGRYNGNFFDASNVVILNNVAQNTTITGKVVSIVNTRRFTMRDARGRIYSVVVPGGLSSSIQVGASVSASGVLNGTVLQRATATYTGGSALPQEGQNVDWTATVLSRDITGNTLSVRWNNRDYVVNYYRPEDFGIGDRVRIVGEYRNGDVDASSVVRVN